MLLDEKEFALRIAKLRTNKKVSAREMSLAIGQNEGYINHIESGKSLPSLSGLSYICEYLGITLSEFFDDEAENPVRLRSIIQKLKSLNEKQLVMIEDIIDNFR